jgi:prepilin-type processing-associated H-X9-DG protein
MKSKNSFTKKDLLVVLLCGIFCLANIAAIGEGGRMRAKQAVCLSRFLKWGQVYHAYTADNDGYFHSRGGTGSLQVFLQQWPYVYKPYYIDPKMRYCPAADKTYNIGGTFGVWNIDEYGSYDPVNNSDLWVPGEKGPCLGSYGENRFIVNMLGSFASDPWYWRRVDYKNAAQVPIFMDAQYLALWGFEDAVPPEYEGDYTGGYTQAAACINRHNGYINCLFMDWSARKVGLKELWTLKWHRLYDTCGPWTICGNGGDEAACADKWDAQSPWMKDFPEY